MLVSECLFLRSVEQTYEKPRVVFGTTTGLSAAIFSHFASLAQVIDTNTELKSDSTHVAVAKQHVVRAIHVSSTSAGCYSRYLFRFSTLFSCVLNECFLYRSLLRRVSKRRRLSYQPPQKQCDAT